MPGMTIQPCARTSQMSVRTMATTVIVTPERRVEPRSTSCTMSTISRAIARISDRRMARATKNDRMNSAATMISMTATIGGAASADADDAVDQGEDAAEEADDEEPGQGDHGGFLPYRGC